jgi:hypothetical protein
MTNQYNTTLDYMFVQYKDPDTGRLGCEAFKNVTTDWATEISVPCTKSTKAAFVTITVVDSSFDDNDHLKATLPSCCGDNAILGEYNIGVVKYLAGVIQKEFCCEFSTQQHYLFEQSQQKSKKMTSFNFRIVIGMLALQSSSAYSKVRISRFVLVPFTNVASLA